MPRLTQVPPPSSKARCALLEGKSAFGAAGPPSDSEEDDEGPLPEVEGDIAFAGEQDFLRVASDDGGDGEGSEVQKTGKMNLSLKNVNISEEGKVIISGKEELSRGERVRSLHFDHYPSEYYLDPSEESEEESGGETAKEDPKIQLRPVFVLRRSRVTVAEKQSLAEDSEEAIRKKQAEAEQRRKESHDLVAESIRRELLEKEKEEEHVDVDNTDGLDPLGDFDAWRLREPARIKRDRRKSPAKEQRMKEDLAHAQRSWDEKPKGGQIFLQKYWHKEILKRHDFTEATESTVDVSLLPTVMQVKNFGKRERTKYTHLLDQDTTVGSGGIGGTGPVKTGGRGTDSAGCFHCGGPHMKKDCPQYTGALSGNPGTGPNAAPKGIRDERQSSRNDDDRKSRQAQSSDRGRRRSRSRSEGARAGDDKRRRLDERLAND
ncbi:microfibrillar-associated protein MFAP1, Zn finger, CCHC type protein [Lactarius deliciosus]|nr:microfibrillar-associated protein MFAP1, Zn finger, CCHC type protein [Lactarius deliciosus]